MITKFIPKISFKTFMYRAYLGFLLLISIYALAGITHFKLLYINIDRPTAEFLIKEPASNTTKPINVIEFLDYTCPHCKKLHPTVEELLTVRKDIRYIVRPVAFNKDTSEPILRHVLAAGLQGKFWEMHNAVLEYPETIVPQEFFEQTAELYGLNVEQYLKDANSKQVDKIIKENVNAVYHAGVTATPSFLIGTKIYQSGNSTPTLVDLIKMVQKGE